MANVVQKEKKMNRRQILWTLAATASVPAMAHFLTRSALAEAIDVDAILHDPEAPENGNPKGDVTIVAFFDYNCPFCKRAEPDLEKLVKAEGNIRLVYKDWPILTEASVYAAQMALAAKYQGKYQQIHDALMAIPGPKIPKEQMLAAIKATSIDLTRLDADLKAHGADIAGLLQRNHKQADSMGLQGTPVYLIGPLKVAQALDYDGFKDAVAQARARAKPRS